MPLDRAPGFDKKLRENVIMPAFERKRFGTYAMITHFNPLDRRAAIVIANPGSNKPGRIVKNVPVPTMLGVQTVDPVPGQICWVQFKDGEEGFPVIMMFFNRDYSEQDWVGHQKAPPPLPDFMLS